jgi:iron-sulfur cluster assembly protein
MSIQLSTRAIEHLQHQLKASRDKLGLRLGVKQSGCSGYSYVLDWVDEAHPPQPVDHVFDYEGVQVFVDPQSLPLLEGIELDYVARGMGKKVMVFKNPQATGECGCGESFAVKTKSSTERE